MDMELSTIARCHVVMPWLGQLGVNRSGVIGVLALGSIDLVELIDLVKLPQHAARQLGRDRVAVLGPDDRDVVDGCSFNDIDKIVAAAVEDPRGADDPTGEPGELAVELGDSMGPRPAGGRTAGLATGCVVRPGSQWTARPGPSRPQNRHRDHPRAFWRQTAVIAVVFTAV
ncbi:MAG: hypothetical protein ACRDRO_10405, partial [Pseudonocardiaceae bacterium]